MNSSVYSPDPHIEGEYEVLFGSEWHVVKLDDSRFFSYISGRGYKSVDFLALHQTYGLALIELKNYRDREATPTVEVISETFYQKCEDSMLLIEIVTQYYNRKLIYRCMTKYEWTRRFMPAEWRFWYAVSTHYAAGRVLLLGDIAMYR